MGLGEGQAHDARPAARQPGRILIGDAGGHGFQRRPARAPDAHVAHAAPPASGSFEIPSYGIGKGEPIRRSLRYNAD